VNKQRHKTLARLSFNEKIRILEQLRAMSKGGGWFWPEAKIIKTSAKFGGSR
jgi:hypothetical protein